MSVGLPLSGRRVALFETREAERLGAMFREQGAEVISCPAMTIVPFADPVPVAAWLERFVSRPPDDLILMTGEGLAQLRAVAGKCGNDAAFLAALAGVRTITRGPKPARALRFLGLEPHLRGATPTTDGIVELLSGLPLRGRRFGVQLYPGAAGTIPEFLATNGATPDAVTPYDYAPLVSDDALDAVIGRIIGDEIDAVVFTSAAQARRLFELAQARSEAGPLKSAMARTAVAAVGPVVASALAQHGVAATIVPHGTYFMKPLVTAVTDALGRRA